MLFQTVDSPFNKDCLAYYSTGKIFYSLEDLLKETDISRTWSYSTSLNSFKQIQYASIYSQTNKLSEYRFSSENQRKEFNRLSSLFKNYLLSLKKSKIQYSDICLYDFVPERFLIDFSELKNQICSEVFSNTEKPMNHDFLVETSDLILGWGMVPVKFDSNNLPSQYSSWKIKIQNSSNRIKLNLFGTKTGRFSEQSNSFPILTLPAALRSFLKPRNHWFLELDFNAAELRTALALSEIEQPEEDLHEWVRKNIFNSKTLTRDGAKKKIISWFYDSSQENPIAEKFFKKSELLEKYLKNNQIVTPRGKVIESDREHGLNHLLQATTHELAVERAIKITKMLENKRSFVVSTIHDSVVIDVHYDDRDMIQSLREIYSNTSLGKFPVKARLGKDFGDMKLVKV